MSTRKPPFLRLVGTEGEAEQSQPTKPPRRARLALHVRQQMYQAIGRLMRENGLSFEAASAIVMKVGAAPSTPAVTDESPNDRTEREAKSPAIKAAVRYIGAMAALHEGFKADHTFDGVVAGFNDQGWAATQLRVARRQLTKLTLSCRLSQDASPVEMAAKASVAKFIMLQWRAKNWEVERDANEARFLDAFAGQAEEVFTALYNAQIERERA